MTIIFYVVSVVLSIHYLFNFHLICGSLYFGFKYRIAGMFGRVNIG